MFYTSCTAHIKNTGTTGICYKNGEKNINLNSPRMTTNLKSI